MDEYTTYGEIQEEMRSHFRKYGTGLQFPEALQALRLKGKLSPEPKELRITKTYLFDGSPTDFDSIIDELPFQLSSEYSLSEQVNEGAIIPLMKDVFVIRHPRYTRLYLHRHDYVELDCVLSGSCTLFFEEEQHTLDQGTLCVIAPGSSHDIQIRDESIVCCIMLRRSTFEAVFFSLLSREDPLSVFFRNILKGEGKPNYLMFRGQVDRYILTAAFNAILECNRADIYSNHCCISLVNLLLAAYLRMDDMAPEYYHYQLTGDFHLMLQYIRHHYRNLTLGELAEEFHYSKPHLCTLIKQNTGVSFTSLIRQIRMARDVEYLVNTDLPVSRVAEILGYNSADHFSRVFRSEMNCSPMEFRRKQEKRDDRFIPFEMK